MGDRLGGLWLPEGARPEPEPLPAPPAGTMARVNPDSGELEFVPVEHAESGLEPDDAVFLPPHGNDPWGLIQRTTDNAKVPSVMVNFETLRQAVLDQTAKVELYGLVAELDGTPIPVQAYLRCSGYHVYVNVADAPAGWVDQAKVIGFALTFDPMPNGAVPWLATGMMLNTGGKPVVLPGVSRSRQTSASVAERRPNRDERRGNKKRGRHRG